MIKDLACALALVAASAGSIDLALEAQPGGPAVTGTSSGAIAVEPPQRAPARRIDLPRGDPFRPFDQPGPSIGAAPITGKTSREKMRFYGVMQRGAEVWAQINDGFYKVGDRIDGATIKSIEPGRVILDRDGVPDVLTDEES